ncbi:bifunctional diguanylate cyclase/phosphodiesterase [Evansella clarkii]|uniref:bifunctional diguanylate cyclase/phosphodiesterase n=1 Tax=Evansella clarkii TaxID=79879 RepID=UPI0009965D5E|nr:bifunctional diguanylate cyclase/phosphodiesterase [Evansella clarkii]
MKTTELRQYKILFGVGLLLYILAYYLIILLGDGSRWPVNLSTNLFSAGGAFIAAVCLFYAARNNSCKRFRLLWFWLGSGCLSFFAGDLIWVYYENYLQVEVPFPGLPDIFYMLQILCYLAGFTGYYFYIQEKEKGFQFFFELLLLMIIAAAVKYYFVIERLFQGPEVSGMFLVIALGYPIGDLAIFFTAAVLFFITKESSFRPAFTIILLAILVQTSADTVYMYLNLDESYAAGSLIDPLFTLSLLLMGYSSFYTNPYQQAADINHYKGQQINIARLTVPYLSVLALILFIILFDREHQVLTIAGFSAIVLVVARQVAVLIHNRKLVKNLNNSNEQFKSLFENHPDAALIVGLDGELIKTNKAYEELASAEQFFTDNGSLSYVNPAEKQKAERYFQKACQGLPQYFEMAANNRERETRDLAVSYIPMKVEGEITGVFVIAQDITEKKKNSEKIYYLAYHDALTGLPNRDYFEKCLEEELKKAEESSEKFGVIYLDIDRFKIINDTLGHDAGDELLQAVSDRLKAFIREGDITARYGGDEFVILMNGVSEHSVISKWLDGFKECMNEPYNIKGNEFISTISIGAACFNGGRGYKETAMSILKKADLAMYSAKNNGKNQYVFYVDKMEKDITALTLESEIRKAVKNNEFRLHYQPQIHSPGSNSIAAEALIRWQHPGRGLLFPGEFLALAEETNLIVEIGEWVLREACLQGKRWQNEGKNVRVSVNISPIQFISSDLTALLSECLAETGLDPQLLVLEVTEAIAMKDIEQTMEKLTKIKAMGVQTSIDDFGTGHSSLAYLAHLPIDELKIPREFISRLGEGANDSIVKSIIDLAVNLNISVIAEGVETDAQRIQLERLGCRRMQGYLFSKPLTAENASVFFKEYNSKGA